MWEDSSGTPIDFGEDGEKINALIIDIGKNTFEVRGYRYTDHEFAARMKLVDLDDNTFFLKQIDFVNDEGKWQKESDITKINIDYTLNEAKTEITLILEGVENILMKKTVFTQLGDLVGTWESGGMTMVFGNKNFTYTESGYECSGTWDASVDDSDPNEGIVRTVMTEENGKSGLSYGSASPYKLDGDKLTITYPNETSTDTTEIEFTKQTP